MQQLAQSLTSGLLTGVIFAVLGVGFSLTWGVTRAINVAHTAFAVLAAYVAYWILQIYKIDPAVSVLGIVPLMFLLGLGIYRLFIRPVTTRVRELELASMVLTFGLASAMENGIAFVWTPDPRVLNTSYTGQAWQLLGISVPKAYAVASAISLATVLLLHLFMSRTFTGKAVRAVWQNRDGAALCGIDINVVTAVTYGISMASAGVAGIAMALIYTFDPASQFGWLIYAFLVVIIGGVGSILGSLFAGLLVGAVIGLSGLIVPFVWSNLILFVLLTGLLFIRPGGLLKR
jgi:branched-chain amino acid transport system permease protein